MRGLLRRTLRLLAEPAGPTGSYQHGHLHPRDRPKPMLDQSADLPEVVSAERHRIGWVGLGDMGMGMAWKLAAQPTNTLHVWTRSERKLRAYRDMVERDLNRHVFERPLLLDVPRFADVIFVSLANIRAAREVLLERDDAILFNAREGTVVVDHSTVDLDTAAECHRISAARGVHFLDAPVAGNPELASAGNLTVMAGGDPKAFARVRNLMLKYAHCVEFMGPPGNGVKAKLVHEQAAAIHCAAAAETALMARALGLRDLERLTRVCDASLGGSHMLRRCAPYWPKQFTSRVKTGTGATVSRAVRNMALLDGFVKGQDAKWKERVGSVDDGPGPLERSLPLTATAREAFRRCGDAGGHDADVSSVVHFMDAQSPRGDSILPVAWDIPVTDAVRSEAVRQQQQREEASSSLSASAVLEIDEFDDVSDLGEWKAPGSAPSIDPARLRALYDKNKARPVAAAPEGSAGTVLRGGGWDPTSREWDGAAYAQRRTLDTFAAAGRRMDAKLGKASFGTSTFHQRPAQLIDPFRAGLVPGQEEQEQGTDKKR